MEDRGIQKNKQKNERFGVGENMNPNVSSFEKRERSELPWKEQNLDENMNPNIASSDTRGKKKTSFGLKSPDTTPEKLKGRVDLPEVHVTAEKVEEVIVPQAQGGIVPEQQFTSLEKDLSPLKMHASPEKLEHRKLPVKTEEVGAEKGGIILPEKQRLSPEKQKLGDGGIVPEQQLTSLEKDRFSPLKMHKSPEKLEHGKSPVKTEEVFSAEQKGIISPEKQRLSPEKQKLGDRGIVPEHHFTERDLYASPAEFFGAEQKGIISPEKQRLSPEKHRLSPEKHRLSPGKQKLAGEQTEPGLLEKLGFSSGKVESREKERNTSLPEQMMHALVWYGKKDVRYEEVVKPQLIDPEDVLVKITALSICGSDMHLYANEIMDLHKGQIVGHEGMGIVEEIGSDVHKLKKGQRVVIAFGIACGECSHCKRREFTGCERTNKSELMKKQYGHPFAGILGFGDIAGGYSGCQAEFVRVPFADVNCLVIPEGVPDEKALLLSDVACTSFHAAIELGKVQKGDKVAIWGAGPIGLLTAKWCELFEAKEIFVIENVPERLEWVKDKVPLVHIINFDKVDVNKELARLCPEGVDVSIECAGFRYAKGPLHVMQRAIGLETDTAELLNECIMATRLYGRVVLISDYVGYANHVNLGGLMEKHLYLAGGQCPCQAVWDKVLPKIQDGSFDPTICITHRGTLSDGVRMYDDMFYKRGGVIKTFLRPCIGTSTEKTRGEMSESDIQARTFDSGDFGKTLSA